MEILLMGLIIEMMILVAGLAIAASILIYKILRDS